MNVTVNKSEFRRYVKSRYPGGHWNRLTGHYYIGCREYRDDDMLRAAEAEKEEWILGFNEKPEWIVR